MNQTQNLTFPEKLGLLWFFIDAFTHLTIEAGYVWLALTTTAKYTDSFMGGVWRQYGRADARWEVRDPNVISLELATVCLMGPLCLLQMYGIYYRKPWRHCNQIIVCACELYGGWMTFAPEWVEGSPNLNGSTFILLWIYLTFMNGLWVVLPGLFLWESCAETDKAFRVAAQVSDVRSKKTDDRAVVAAALDGAGWGPSMTWYYMSAALVALYIVLVPAILGAAPFVPVSIRA